MKKRRSRRLWRKPPKEVACEDKDEEKKENEQLDTGDMESIDLSEIVNNLPNADDELKALIDKML